MFHRSSLPVARLLVVGTLLALVFTPAARSSPLITTTAATDTTRALISPLSDVGGAINAIVADGSYAYIGEGNTLVVLDVHDPSEPEPVGALAVPFGKAQLVGDLLYTAAGDLYIINVSNPRRPVLQATVPTPGAASDVQVVGGSAYVADGLSGVQIVDLSARPYPEIRAAVETPGDARSVAVAGGWAYIADTTGVQIANITAPQPVVRAAIPTTGSAVDVAIDGQTLYVAVNGAGGGLLLFDVRRPLAPQRRGVYQAEKGVSAVQLVGDRAFVSAETLDILDVSNIERPVRRGSYVPSLPFYVANDVLYAVIGEYIALVNVRDAAEPYDVGYYLSISTAIDVHLANGFAFAGDIQGLFWVVDVRDPARPRVRSVSGLPAAARDIEVAGGFAYLIAGTELVIADVRDVTAPILLGSVELGRDAQEVRVANGVAYVAGGSDGLLLIDVREPEQPELIAQYPTETPAFGVDLAASIAYVAAGVGGVLLIDVGDPAKPQLLGVYATPGAGGSRDVVIAGSRAYVGLADAGFQVVDVANPARPTLIGATETAGSLLELTVADEIAYLTEVTRVEVVDLRDAAQPRVAGGYIRADNGSGSGTIAAAGDLAILADARAGLQLLRVQIADFVQYLPRIVG